MLADVDAYCQELRPIEELCYVEHRYNEQTIELAKKYNLLGMPVPVEYGGRGADARPTPGPWPALAARGPACARSSPARRRSASTRSCATAMPSRRRYLPPSCRGEMILAFGLTEPDAGSNPLEMTTTYRREGDQFLLNGVKYLISNGGIADAVVVFALSRGRASRHRAPDERLHRRHRRATRSRPKTCTPSWACSRPTPACSR